MPEFAEFDINDDILHINLIKFHGAQANTETFQSWDHVINGISYNDEYENLITGSTSIYTQTNINWNNMTNRINTLYEDNRTEFDVENEGNFILNSEGAYQKKFGANTTFYDWDCANHAFNGLYNNQMEFGFSSAINQTGTEQNEIEIFKSDHRQLYKELLSKKEVDPRWYVEVDWDPNKLAEKLIACVLEEDKKTEYALFRASVLKAALVATADSILPNINLDASALYSKNLTDIIAKLMLDLIDTNKIVEMWDETSSDLAQESFLVAQKFEVEQSATMSWNGSVSYLSALNDIVYEMQNINRKTIDERKLYGEAWGKARAALMVAVRRCDYNFISILDKYLDDCQELSSNSDSDVVLDSTSNSESEDDTGKRKLDPKELMNPHKRKSKGRPKRTNRIRRANEPPSKKVKRKLHCKICEGTGHNRVTCSKRQE
ncbi:18169_t:CDS:2 [Gigaspora rosea]|nr:18169_t:CDS:2 [Gigaspora rosea]